VTRAAAIGAPGAVTAAGDEVLDKIEEFSDRVRVLSGTVTSMEAQLLDLYAEKDLLHQEVGVTRAADIVARLREAAETRAELAVATSGWSAGGRRARPARTPWAARTARCGGGGGGGALRGGAGARRARGSGKTHRGVVPANVSDLY
jgi:hypothetical protein